MDTKNTKTKTMPKMQIALLEQTKKKRGKNQMKTQNNEKHNNNKLLNPKADVLTKLDYGRVSARLQVWQGF